MALLRRYMWLWVICGAMFGSLIVVIIFVVINRCISRTGKHRIAHLQRRMVFNKQSNTYQETTLESVTPPLPPRTQFLMAEAQSYENLADTPEQGKTKKTNDNKQLVDDYEQALNDNQEPKDDYEQPQEEYVQPVDDYEQPQEEYVQPLDDYEQPQEEYVQPLDDYEQPQEEYVQPLDDYEQPQEEYVQPLDDYEQPEEEYLQPLDVGLQSEDILSPPFNNPAPSMDSVSMDDYDDIGVVDENQSEEDYDDVG